jgi:hypothetical protein
MANTALWEVQKSVVAAMTASSTLTTLVSSKIYDEPPTDTNYPYITVGNPTEVTDNNLQELGFDDTLTCYIYTRPYGLGWKQAYTILDAMNNVLNCKRLTLDTLHCVICKQDNVMRERYDDKRILHVRYRVPVEKLSTHTV